MCKKFSKSDGLPGVLRVPGVKRRQPKPMGFRQRTWCRGAFTPCAARRRPQAPGVHGAASPCKIILLALPVEIKASAMDKKEAPDR